MLLYPMVCLIYVVNAEINYDLLPNSENEGVENTPLFIIISPLGCCLF